MSNDIIQAHYDGLASVANRFGNQAQSNQELLTRVRQTMRQLQGDGWQGRGSTAFFAEMDGEVLPARAGAVVHGMRSRVDRETIDR